MLRNHKSRSGKGGVTLVELLVVVALISVLIALLIPTLARTLEQARLVQCASNMRQICVGLIAYSAESRGKFPRNTTWPGAGHEWWDWEAIGHIIPSVPYTAARASGGVFVCPDDPNAALSYAMNIWASSQVDDVVRQSTLLTPPRGELWDSRVKRSSQMILLAETFSGFGAPSVGWWPANGFIGFLGITAGERFGAGAGVPAFSVGRFGRATSELAFTHHRKRGTLAVGNQAKGLLNVGYADGHVTAKSDSDLSNAVTGNSTGDTWWSPADVMN